MKREIGEHQISKKDVKVKTLTSFHRCQKVNHLNLFSSKYYWNF